MVNRIENNKKCVIEYTTGNIFDSTCQCIVIPVNVVGIMGAGLAKQAKYQYPQMFKTYKKHCSNGTLSIGRIMFYKHHDDEKLICLMPTKLHWRDSSKLMYIESSLKSFCKYYIEWNIFSVAFPKLGCGLGGLDWQHHVKPLMEQYLSDLPIEIQIYE